MKVELALSVPPVAVASAKLFLGYTLPEWAAIVTIIYTVLLAIRLIFSELRDWRKANGKAD